MKTTRIPLLLAAALVLAACSGNPPRERQAESLALYQAAAGEPVDSLWFPRLHSWEPLGEDRLVVRTGPGRAYLLQVERPCTELPWANAISLTSSTGSVHARFDAVLVAKQRCRILEIRPVDEAAYRTARVESRRD